MGNFHLYQADTVGSLVARAIRRFSSRVALVDGTNSMTYAELGIRIGKHISLYKSLGLVRGEGLAQLAGNRLESVCVFLAANIMGLRYTPLHPLGSEEDHLFILNDASISAVVVDTRKFAGRVEAIRERVSCVRHILTFDDSDLGTSLAECLEITEAVPFNVEADADDIAWLAYTGGTTGRPKGVILPHSVLTTNISMALSDWNWAEEVNFLAVTPISHASGIMIPPVFHKGGTVHILGSFSPQSFSSYVQEHRITMTFLVPTMIYSLLDDPDVASSQLKCLQTVIYGAASISPSRLKQAIQRFGKIFMQLYGQTEAPNTICAFRREDHDLSKPNRLHSCGRPMAGIQVKLLDESCNEVEPGKAGEICVRGPLVMKGYWKREQETAEALKGNWLHTGDVAREDEEGFLYIVDRKKDMIISGGFNVFPREIEDVISSHADILAVSVFGVPDPKWGEKVVAAVVARPGASVDSAEIKQLVKDRKGAVYAPKDVRFIEGLPLTALGKPDKKALRVMFG